MKCTNDIQTDNEAARALGVDLIRFENICWLLSCVLRDYRPPTLQRGCRAVRHTPPLKEIRPPTVEAIVEVQRIAR